MARQAYDHGMGLSGPDPESDELPDGWNGAAFHKLQHLQIYGTNEVLRAATMAYNSCRRWGKEIRCGVHDRDFHLGQDNYEQHEFVFTNAVRRDLGLVARRAGSEPLPDTRDGRRWGREKAPPTD